MKRRRIAFHSENGEEIGGSDLYMARLILGMKRDDWEPLVVVRPGYPLERVFDGARVPALYYGRPCAPRPDTEAVSNADETAHTQPSSLGGIYRKAPVSLRKMLGLVRCALAQRRVLRLADIQLLHTMDGGPQPMAVAGALAGCKVVMSYSAAPPDTTQIAATRVWDRLAYRSAAVCVAPSQYAREAWTRYLCNDGDKIRILPHGVKVPVSGGAQAPTRATLGLTPADRVVCYVGRLAPEKGPDLLMDAMPAVLNRVPGAKLLLVGEGAFRPVLERKAVELNIVSSTIFLGFRHDVQDIMKLADVIVIPSSRMYETFGLAALEAMSSGRPVVAARWGAVPEVVLDGETGLLVDTSQSSEIAAAVLRVLENDELRERLGHAGRLRAVRDFSDETTIGRYYSLYESLLN